MAETDGLTILIRTLVLVGIIGIVIFTLTRKKKED